MAVERWAAIPLAPGYEASDQGRVRSFRRGAPPEGRILQPATSATGYFVVRIKYDDKWQVRHVHRLVLEAFVGPRPEGGATRHLNDVKEDNSLGNLTWGTYSENAYDRVRNGIHNWASRTECLRGHPYTDENTLWRETATGTSRRCRICQNAKNRAYKQRVRTRQLAKERTP